jgi:regulatory protein YycH of two-component signal transduction system YycFG
LHVKKENEEIRKNDAEELKRLRKKSKFVTSNSIKFTRDEYDKLKTAFYKGKGWDLEYPDTVNVRSIILTGNYKWMPASNVEFQVEIE